MAYRINHVHLKAPDPRKTAEWYTQAFNFKIVNDETRVFGDRFIRCQSEDGGLMVNISGARTGEKLGPGDASAHHGLEHFGFDSVHLETDIARLETLGAKLLGGRSRTPTARASRSSARPTTCASSWSSRGRPASPAAAAEGSELTEPHRSRCRTGAAVGRRWLDGRL